MIDEWKANIETMKARGAAAPGQVHVEYLENVAELQRQFDDLKIKAAKAWDAADDKWDSVSKDLELAWEEWAVRAKKAWDDLAK
jgi:phage-related minor tail protein